MRVILEARNVLSETSPVWLMELRARDVDFVSFLSLLLILEYINDRSEVWFF